MTVREMLERIDSIEIAQWIAYYELEKEEEEFRGMHRSNVNNSCR